jgi:hypothetical protein
MTHSEAVEAAAKHSYEHEGDRKGVFYIGWENEPEEVKAEWRGCVSEPIAAYLEARGAVLCSATPVGWADDVFADLATNEQLDYRGKEHSERVRKLYPIPLFVALSDNPKGEA